MTSRQEKIQAMTALLLIGLGPLLLLTGYLIKYKGMIRILAGFQSTK